MRIDRTGEKYITNEGYEITIVDYIDSNNCSISFECGFTIDGLQYGGVKGGRIKYPYHKSVFNVGYFGFGRFFQKRKGILMPFYNTWKNMIERCYSDKNYEKNKAYRASTVCEVWHNFQVFAKWMGVNYDPETMEGWHLDKDILQRGNKIYSPETCCFVPNEINTLFIKAEAKRGNYPIGVIKHKNVFRARINKNKKYIHLGLFDTPKEAFEVYKFEKEKYIKEIADKWKDLIDPRVYQAMYDYQVGITD